jgi:hypothetical protein
MAAWSVYYIAQVAPRLVDLMSRRDANRRTVLDTLADVKWVTNIWGLI